MLSVWQKILPFLLAAVCASAYAADAIHYDFAKNTVDKQIVARHARTTLVRHQNAEFLRVDTLSDQDAKELKGLPPLPKPEADLAKYPGVTLPLADAPWDISAYETLEVDVVNLDPYGSSIRIRIESDLNGQKKSVTKTLWQLAAGQKITLRIPLAAIDDATDHVSLPLSGVLPPWMKQGGLDLSRVVNVMAAVDRPDFSHSFLIGNLRVSGKRESHNPPANVYPLLDQFGQYVHQEWTGKVHSVDDLKSNLAREKNDLENNPPPGDWDRFGGWAKGPRLAATGYFRVQQYNGKWWLVTPEGTLFFSRGPNTIDTWQMVQYTGRETWHTPISDRQFFVMFNPGTPQAKQWYNYGALNLYRKYGKEYRDVFMDLTHTRLQSWGFNTIANCSNVDLCGKDKTPFYIKVQTRKSPKLQGYDFFDVFDPEYRKTLQAGMKEYVGKFGSDPWCVGFFVDNELRWGLSENDIPLATLKSPGSPAKKAFISDLKSKYSTIESLNKAWGSSYASWDAMLGSTDLPDVAKAEPDLKAFFIRTAETYFSMAKEELKIAAPNHLYFGARFSDSGSNETALRVSARYVDVLSFNYYGPLAQDFFHIKHIADLQMPIIVSEFHIGALDRGLFDTGLGPCAQDQAERVRNYKSYVYDLLADPRIVGGHYFQFRDQPLTGDVHREAAQIGFVDVADTPYWEMIEASREIGKKMYEYRMNAPVTSNGSTNAK